jgi:topoisomerase-4 subunit A
MTEKHELTTLIDVKGWKALGNKLHDGKLLKVIPEEAPAQEQDDTVTETPTTNEDTPQTDLFGNPTNKKHKPGDTIEFD